MAAFLTILFIGLILISFLCMLGTNDEKTLRFGVCLFMSSGLGIFYLLFAASNAARPIKETKELPIVMREGAQCIAMEDKFSTHYVNLNDRYKRIFDPSDTIKQTTYQEGWSYLIYWDEWKSISL